jgi:hypothetical protein
MAKLGGAKHAPKWGRRVLCWIGEIGLGLGLVLLLAVSGARAEGAWWPAAPSALAASLASGSFAAEVAEVPPLSLRLSSGHAALPRVQLSPAREQILLRPPLAVSGGLALARQMPEPPGLSFEKGWRLVVVRPDVRLTTDRKGCLLSVRGTF